MYAFMWKLNVEPQSLQPYASHDERRRQADRLQTPPVSDSVVPSCLRGAKMIRRHLPVFFFQAEDGIRDGTVTGVQTLLFRSRRLLPDPGTPEMTAAAGRLSAFALEHTESRRASSTRRPTKAALISLKVNYQSSEPECRDPACRIRPSVPE